MVSVSMNVCKWEDGMRSILTKVLVSPHMDTCYQSRGTPAKLFPMNINSFAVSFCYWRSHAIRNRKKKHSLLFIYYLWQPLIWCLFTRRSEKQMVLWHFQTNARRGEITLMVWRWLKGGEKTTCLCLLASCQTRRQVFWCQLCVNIHQLM